MMRMRRHGGWSLVELSVVLATIAVLGVVLWRVLPLAPKLAEDDAATRDLAQAEQALLGYALAHDRLPAAVMEHGRAMLPTKALGLPSRIRLRYQVQPTLTVSPGNSFAPLLPVTLNPGSPSTASINGLDLCMSLKADSGKTLDGMQDIPTAFALMHLGPVGQQQTADLTFALPGSQDIGTRRVLAVGPGELASRLSCPDRITGVHGATREAFAAYDLARIAAEYEDFRKFAIQVAEMNKANAETGKVFAGFDIAWGIVVEAIAILQTAAGWPPDALAMVTGIASHAAATAQLAIAIVNLDGAISDLEEAVEDLAEAKDQHEKAKENTTRMRNLAHDRRERAIALDAKGLQP